MTLARFGVAGWALVSVGLKPVFNRQPTQVRQPDKPQPPPRYFSVLKPTKDEIQFLSNICPPLKKDCPPKRIPVLQDLYCRVSNPDYFADANDPSDLVTHVHELTHGVSNRLHASTARHGIYLLDGKGIVLYHPKVTIAQVAAAVPKEERGKIFDLYLVKQQKDWNDSPIYLLDEANSYIHGGIAQKQLNWGDKRKETFTFAWEMLRYCDYMVQVVEKRDPEYRDLDTLKKFIQWQKDRLTKIEQS